MPVTGVGKTVADKGATGGSAGPGGGGRTTFRPPWVKADIPDSSTTTKSSTASTTKPTPAWLKKADTSSASPSTVKTAAKENGQSKTVTPVKTTPLKTTAVKTIPAKTTPSPIIPAPAAARKEVKLQSREIKVPIMTEKPKPVQPILKPKEKRPPTPSDSETETEETETESEEEEEEEEEEETELEKKFKEEKPKMRPVVISKDKSFSSAKKREDEEAEDDDDGDEEERERQRRFKLERPKLRPVVVNKHKAIQKTKTSEDFEKIRPVLRRTPKADESKVTPDEPKPEFKDKVLKKVPSITRKDSIVKSNVPAPPPLPSLVPKPPPPPPPPLAPPQDFTKKPLTEKQKQVIEKLKTRPRRRPDWSEMMKEVESGRKLRHVECNDRSKPIITCKSMTKVDNKFVYETEKANAHNKLLQQIQGGVRLKPTKTNDRSKPILEGLRKFRRQMTLEEQLQKSESRAMMSELSAAPSPIESSGDEMDDIDKLRDDLQSTKQMLALELRNKEAQERENKRLLAKIANLEAELEREKWCIGANGESQTKSALNDEALVQSLKQDADEARKTCKDLEKKYQDTAEQLDAAKSESEEQKRQIAALEKKLAQALQGGGGSLGNSRRPSEAQPHKESSPEMDLESESESEEEDEEKKAAKAVKRLAREVKMLQSKLSKLKDKQAAAKKERAGLKEAMKKNQALLKEENKRFKKLEKEVKKMAATMNEDEDEEKEEDEEEDVEEEEEEESEEESESEESEEESDSEEESESEDESAEDQDKKTNLEPRVKRYENRLSALKKGNYLLQANVENLQDEINKVRDKAKSLQAELDAVISDLGL